MVMRGISGGIWPTRQPNNIDKMLEMVCRIKFHIFQVFRFAQKLDGELERFKNELDADSPGVSTMIERRVMESLEAKQRTRSRKFRFIFVFLNHFFTTSSYYVLVI